MSIVWSRRAYVDLENIISYIALNSPANALHIFNEIQKHVQALNDFPEIGYYPKDPQLMKLNYRILVVEKYLIFYNYNKDSKKVSIIGIVHGAQNYKHLFATERMYDEK